MGIKFEVYNEKSKNIYYYTHQGLGDLISCSSIVNYLTEVFPDKNIVYICQTNNHAKNISNLIKYKERVVLYVPSDWENGKSTDKYDHLEYFRNLVIKNNDSLVFSGGNRYFTLPDKYWDYAFYKNISVDYEVKYNHFYIDYDKETIKKTFSEIVENTDPYIFVHDDPTRGRLISIENKENLKVVRNDMRYTIFDYIEVVKNARECHMMGSSLLCLIDFFDLNYEKCKFYFYDFRGSNVNFKGKEKWIQVK